MYIIIAYCCVPIGDVFSFFQDVIIVYGHLCKFYVVSQESIPQVEYNKMYF